jgi:hypothetical protein
MPMLCPDLRDVRVYLHREPVDMRRQRNGLAALVRAVIIEDPFQQCAVLPPTLPKWPGGARGVGQGVLPVPKSPVVNVSSRHCKLSAKITIYLFTTKLLRFSLVLGGRRFFVN